MELIKIDEFNSAQLPNEKQVAFIICNKTIDQAELVAKAMGGGVKEINLFGKWGTFWQAMFDKYIDDKKGRCENLNLASFINLFCEYQSEDVVLYYDDEELKDYILFRSKQKNVDPFGCEERIELNAHSNRSANIGVCSPSELINVAKTNNQKALAITDYLSTQGFYEASTVGDIRVLYGCEVPLGDGFVGNLICKNKDGKKALYKLLSVILSDGNNDYIDLLNNSRQDLIVGSGLWGLFSLAIENKEEELAKEMAFYDFIEVAPVACYRLFDESLTDKEIKGAISLLIRVANRLNKIVVGTNGPYYGTEDDYLAFSILHDYHSPNNKLPEDVLLHIYPTEEMLYEFYWLNDFELVKDIVINNTHRVVGLCEDFEPLDGVVRLPVVEGAFEKIRGLVYDKFHCLDGENEDPLIRDRIEKELEIIKENGYGSIFYISSELCRLSKERGYPYGVRGMVGNSLVAFLLGISECNPLPVWSGCEWGDGHNLHYEVFMGINGEKRPDIDLDLHPDFNKQIGELIEEIAPGNMVIKAGGYKCLSYFGAKEIVDDFAGEGEEVLPYGLKKDIVDVLGKVSLGSKRVEYGNVIVPNDVDIYEYSPVVNIEGVSYLHNDYRDIYDNFYKQDCFDCGDMKLFKALSDHGVGADKIDIRAENLYKIINYAEDYDDDLFGMEEFVFNLINKTRPQNFTELVKVFALARGTNVWLDNQDILFEQGMPLSKILASGDDVLEFLLEHKMPISEALKIAEYVRKGEAAEFGFSEEQLILFKEYKVPNSFVDICKKIHYMFPRAYAIYYAVNVLKRVWIKINKPDCYRTI